MCSWALSFEYVVGPCAAAQRLKQIQSVAANADHSGFRTLSEKLNLAAIVEAFNVTPSQMRYFANATTKEITALNQHIVSARFEVAYRRSCDH